MTEPNEDIGVVAFRLSEDGRVLHLLDQRALPTVEAWSQLRTVEEAAFAIESLAVRGAPAIGCVASLGLAVACLDFPNDPQAFRAACVVAIARLARTRPTAVNLFVALDQLSAALAEAPLSSSADELRALLRRVAEAHVREDLEMCRKISRHGAGLLPASGGVLTHCNTGALATAGFGTALGVIRQAWRDGKRFHVYADETRPVLQGARLTAWELVKEGIDATLLCDNMAGWLMRRGKIQCAIVGADRITRNGDAANKIGTYSVAVLCKHHGIPFYVAAPWTTIDPELASGDDIEIEERNHDEVRLHGGKLLAPANIRVENPAFDVTPAELIAGLVTDRGVFAPRDLAAALGR
jgi:methylthioribose-1-phosphate isomerase